MTAKVAIQVRICVHCDVEWVGEEIACCWSCGWVWVAGPWTQRWAFSKRGDLRPGILNPSPPQPL